LFVLVSTVTGSIVVDAKVDVKPIDSIGESILKLLTGFSSCSNGISIFVTLLVSIVVVSTGIMKSLLTPLTSANDTVVLEVTGVVVVVVVDSVVVITRDFVKLSALKCSINFKSCSLLSNKLVVVSTDSFFAVEFVKPF